MPGTDYRIYYADGSTYTGDPFCAPALGVIAIVEGSAHHGRRIISGGDYYVRAGTCWESVDVAGLFQYFIPPGPKRVLLGVTVDNAVWDEVMRRANADPGFPPKTGYNVRGE